ncbi:hypothetical protein NPIL_411321 [Nephila pilipes]|uniref:Uncharacterized protein n=1 Tax=Nephila pilipes TaxID=299642 RepID=A0A8X6IL33_NEPPI|nr:hypothetical protein NPIL_411321 [Nephila pilipes]
MAEKQKDGDELPDSIWDETDSEIWTRISLLDTSKSFQERFCDSNEDGLTSLKAIKPTSFTQRGNSATGKWLFLSLSNPWGDGGFKTKSEAEKSEELTIHSRGKKRVLGGVN